EQYNARVHRHKGIPMEKSVRPYFLAVHNECIRRRLLVHHYVRCPRQHIGGVIGDTTQILTVSTKHVHRQFISVGHCYLHCIRLDNTDHRLHEDMALRRIPLLFGSTFSGCKSLLFNVNLNGDCNRSLYSYYIPNEKAHPKGTCAMDDCFEHYTRDGNFNANVSNAETGRLRQLLWTILH
uniref:Uncharacterized protein n=1 Tax=Parascaris univalens TaxID=6257 RepID=A0A914ZQ47_PARUN